MNRSQERFVRATFGHVSELLDDVARLAREDLSPFSKERPDLSRYESRMLLSLVGELRAAMLDALAQLGVERSEPTVSARWSAVTLLTFIDVALSEMQPAALRGYGALDCDDRELVDAVTAELRALVSRFLDLLRGGAYADLEAQVGGVEGPAGEVLRGALVAAREHELVELYPEIAALAERATSPAVDVGVFGRIGSGKSSLVNALVAAPVLPVGATPVTALPLRVERGEPEVLVRFAGTRTETHPLEAVARFAAESENPGNRLGVTALEIHAPTAPEGIRFLDTPGVGAYVTPTTASAFAWLPRCDLGLVLIAAGNAIDQDDLALLSGLRSAGVDWRILLSKADLVPGEQLEETLAYVRAEVGRGLGIAAPAVLPISTVVGHETGLDTLGRESLAPLLRDRGDRSRSRLRQRLRRLVSAVGSALDGPRGTSLGDGLDRRKRLRRASTRVREIAHELETSAADTLGRAADEAARAWRGGHAASGAVRRVLAEPPNTALAGVRSTLDDVARAVPGADSVGEYAMPPLFSGEALPELPPLSPPRLAPNIAPRVRTARRIEPLRPGIGAAYGSYARELRTWADAVLERIARAPGPAGGSGEADSAVLEGLERLAAEV
ncbi:MAG: dynamin family protein [Gemmatimonadota bacterium]|jgi:hypothetical protein